MFALFSKLCKISGFYTATTEIQRLIAEKRGCSRFSKVEVEYEKD